MAIMVQVEFCCASYDEGRTLDEVRVDLAVFGAKDHDEAVRAIIEYVHSPSDRSLATATPDGGVEVMRYDEDYRSYSVAISAADIARAAQADGGLVTIDNALI